MKPVAVLDVYYRDRLAGKLADFEDGSLWQYEPSFLEEEQNLSPYTLEFNGEPQKKNDPRYFGLPGFVADTLPDSYGMRIMEDYFKRNHLDIARPLDRLAYVGDQGIGAISFRPSLPERGSMSPVELAELELLSRTHRQKELSTELSELMRRIGTAGGARPKALITTEEGVEKVCPGYLPGPGREYWMVKFQAGPEDEETLVEHAYSLLAGKCGIRAVETRLMAVEGEEGIYRHLGVRRFDCREGRRFHYVSFSGLLEGNYKNRTSADYSLFLSVAGTLCADYLEKREAFRRCLFNVLVSNQDDHAKNHGFLLQEEGWKLSPAFDLTHGLNLNYQVRGMPVLGKNGHISREDFRQLAGETGLNFRDGEEDIGRVLDGLKHWESVADEVKLSGARTLEILRTFQENSALVAPIGS